MSMQASFNQFHTAVIILQKHSVTDLSSSLQNMAEHQILVKGTHDNNMRKVKLAIARYRNAQNQSNSKKANIQSNSIAPWVPVVQSYQSLSVYPVNLTTSVKQIILAKKITDSLDATMNELQLKVTTLAKQAKNSSDVLDQMQQQIFMLELALDINHFLNQNGFVSSGITESEMQKYYNLYMKGGSS